MSMSEEIKDSRITDALANRRSVIIVGRATIAAKLALFESLLANLPESARLGVIDESGALAEIPENATVIDAKLKGVDAIHRIIRDDKLDTIACPSMRRGDIVRMLMDVSGQENGQVLMINGNIDDARHKYGVFNEEVLHGLDLVDLWIGQLMRALEDSGHLHDTDVIIVSDHGQMDLSRVIKPNVFFADAGMIQVDENGNLRDWTAFCCSNAMSAMVYLKDPANVQDYAKTYAVLQKMAAEGIYGFTTVYTKDETKAMGLDGDFSFVLETDGYTSFSTDWNRPAVRPFDRNDFRYGHATHGYLPEKGPQPTFMAVGPSFRENVWLDSAAMIDEAPTFAALLGVPLPAADGKILQELLR